MNTLGKAITRQFFVYEAGYDALQNNWKDNWEERKDILSATHFFLYQAFRGKDWRKSFTAATNENKLNNGYHPMHKVREIIRQLRFIADSPRPEVYSYIIEPFGPEVTVYSIKQLVKYLPKEDLLLAGPSYVNTNVKIEDQAA